MIRYRALCGNTEYSLYCDFCRRYNPNAIDPVEYVNQFKSDEEDESDDI